MRGVAVARLLRAPGRAVACVLALTLAVGFAVLVQLVGTGVERVVREADTVSVAGADVAVRVDWSQPGADALPGRVAAVPGVASVTRTGSAMHEAALPGATGPRTVVVLATPPAGDLRWGTLTAGRWPSAPGEVAVTEDAAVGQQVLLTAWESEGTDGVDAGEEVPLEVVGLVDPGLASDVPVTGLFLAPEQAVGLGAGGGELLVAGTAQVGARGLLEAVAPRASEVGGEAVDADEVRAERARSSETLVLVLQSGVGAFAALAVLVAVVVVANTWSVLLAQRVREQALLRCVGATRRDLWRSGLTEAALTGLVGGVVGLVLGWAGAVAARAVAVTYLPAGVPLPRPSALTVGLALALGVTASLVAAAAPLLRAREVSPLAALRPVEAVPDTVRVSRLRRAVGALLVVGGTVGLVVGAGTGSDRVLVALPSAFVSFVGVLVLAGAVLPRVAALLAAALRGLGPAGDLAAASAGRNPRRTAATGSAVLIGVTLAVTAAVGAASLRATSTAYIAESLPVDVTVAAPDLSPAAREALVREVRDLDRVSGAVVAAQAEVLVERTGAAADGAVVSYGTTAWAGTLEGVVPAADTTPRPGTVVLSAPVATELAVATGDTVRVGTGEATGVDGAAGGTTTTAVVVVDGDTPLPVLLPAAALGAEVAVPTVAVALGEGGSRGEVVATVDALTATALAADPAAVVDSPVLLLGSVQRTFDVLLAVVGGLLAVTVLIALVGVSNTVSLSLVERRQEHALLRALGVSRARLRRVVALEALVLGAVGAVVGTVLGVGYGVAGTYALVAGTEEVVVAVPWLWLVAVPAGVGAVAVLASLWPAHRASAVAPAAALAPAV